LAFRIQSLDDIMTITKELSSSDYYLFIDFLRKPEEPQDLPCSLFTHQELALARHLGFSDIIALQQEGCPLEGFAFYVLSNPEHFSDEKDLLQKIRELVRDRKWLSTYSRNLVVSERGFTPIIRYGDHTGTYVERVWQARVENRRPDIAAVGMVCILDRIKTSKGKEIESPDRSPLKWAGQHAAYERTILPKDFGDVDLFSMHADKPGLFLHSRMDTPRSPIISSDGDYRLFLKLFSEGFPLVEFSVKLKLAWSAPRETEWPSPVTN